MKYVFIFLCFFMAPTDCMFRTLSQLAEEKRISLDILSSSKEVHTELQHILENIEKLQGNTPGFPMVVELITLDLIDQRLCTLVELIPHFEDNPYKQDWRIFLSELMYTIKRLKKYAKQNLFVIQDKSSFQYEVWPVLFTEFDSRLKDTLMYHCGQYKIFEKNLIEIQAEADILLFAENVRDSLEELVGETEKFKYINPGSSCAFDTLRIKSLDKKLCVLVPLIPDHSILKDITCEKWCVLLSDLVLILTRLHLYVEEQPLFIKYEKNFKERLINIHSEYMFPKKVAAAAAPF